MSERELNIAFYVSGRASRLRNLLHEPDSKLLNATKLVVSDSISNMDLENSLIKKGIRFDCFEYDQLSENKQDTLSGRLLKLFKEHDVHYCFCFGDHILKGELLSSYKNRIINFHPSLLPYYKGRNAIDKAVLDGAQILGNTAHFLTEDVDGGPIIMQSLIHISQFELSGYDAVLDLQLVMIKQIHEWLCTNKLSIEGRKVRVEGVKYNHSFYLPHID